ncbi:MAG: tetratricopeptide repeat protein [bacterium]
MAASSKNMTKELARLVATAQRHVEKGRTDKAVDAYRELARLEPHNIKHWLTIGYLEGKRGNFEEAADIYRKVGNYYDSHKETEKAIAVFRQVLAPCPQDTAVHLKLAELQLKQDRPTEAWEHYRKALGLLLAEDRRGDAVQVLVAMTEVAPDNVGLWIRVAETAVSAGIVERAVSAFTTAMELLRPAGRMQEYLRVAERLSSLTPDNHELIRELGALYLERGDVQTALVKLHRCINRDPRDVQTLTLLVDAFLQLPDLDKAINALQLLADLHRDRGEEQEHALTCQRLLALDPSAAPGAEQARAASADPGAERAEAGPKQTDARTEAAEAAEAGPERAEKVLALLKEAAGYTRIGLSGGAADALRQARELDPTHERVFGQLKVAYLQLGFVDEAVALLVDHAERLADRAPDRAAALLDEAQELNADHPAVFRARMGPLDTDTLDSKAHEVATRRGARAGQRWAGEHSSLRLICDIEQATVKRPMPPHVTVKINVDDLEQALLESQRLREQTGLHRDADSAPSGDPWAMSSQTSRPSVFQSLTTGEIDLIELREVLDMDAAEGAEPAPTPVAQRTAFEPDKTSPRALALSERWRHFGAPYDAD